jgi:protein SCO1/2
MLRNKQALLPYLLLVAALAGGLLWHESENVPGLGKAVVTGQADVGGPFKLIDQTGKTVTDADYRGRYMLIYFGYSFCPDVCPTTLAVMAQALDKLGGDARRVTPIFITIDPERDTPQVLKGYMANFDPTFLALRGTPEQLAAVAKDFKVYYKKVDGKTPTSYTMDHSAANFVYDTRGHLRLYSRYDAGPQALASDLQLLLKNEG